jgi:hypothetical protein
MHRRAEIERRRAGQRVGSGGKATAGIGLFFL